MNFIIINRVYEIIKIIKSKFIIIKQSYWKLPKKKFDDIFLQIKIHETVENNIYFFDAKRLAMGTHPEHKLDVGIIAINDAYKYLKDMEWHLINALSYIEYHKDLCDKTVDARKYLEMVYINMYSSLESLSFFIKIVLKIDKKSEFAKVGEYIRKNFKNNSLLVICDELFQNESFKKMIEFRGKWVHSQRIVLKDEPMPMKRESLWEENKDNYVLYFGTKAQISYHYDIFKYAKIIKDGYIKYLEFFSKILQFFTDKLSKELNIEFNLDIIENKNNYKRYRKSFKRSF